VGDVAGRLFRTRDGLASAPTWEVIDDNAAPDPLPARRITGVVVDALDTNRVLVALGGFTADNVWRTEDGGATWQPAGGRGGDSLPTAPVWSLAQHPERPETWVAGTEVGVYVTEDGGRRWSAVPAPITAAAQDVSFLQGSTTLLVGTFGRGLWTVDLDADRRP